MANIGYIQVTRQCNQKCIICSNPPVEKTLSLKKAKEQVDLLIEDGSDGIIFSGGEPTVWEFLPELIAYAVDKDIACRITTNGQKTSDDKYLKRLLDAGLKHINISIFSHKKEVQDRIARNPGSLKNILKTMDLLKNVEEVNVDANIAIFKHNAGHIAQLVKFLVNKYPYIYHFSFNNLDPKTGRVPDNPDTIPRLNDIELSLYKAFNFIEKTKRTFRVSRVPLCYMAGFEHCSMETRKIVKNETRSLIFLDERGKYEQKGFFYDKGKCCEVCFVKEICAGLYCMGDCYFEEELYPLFISPEKIRSLILNGEN
ncbi:radical SAM protein [bacterium]